MNNTDSVPLGDGPPTREELLVHYPPKFTWEQLKTFVNSGDLGLLKRDKKLQQRYDQWSVGIKQQYSSMVDYLLQRRLQWGKPDTQCAITSYFDGRADAYAGRTDEPPAPPAEYFTADIAAGLLSIIQNDWPYSVPGAIEHTLVWTQRPVVHEALVPPAIRARVYQDGLWGFTGTPRDCAPGAPETVRDALPALADWGVTLDKLVVSPPPSEEERVMLRNASREVDGFVKRRWSEDEWETAWFVNPPRLQSIPGLAHIHVFARRKSEEEMRLARSN